MRRIFHGPGWGAALFCLFLSGGAEGGEIAFEATACERYDPGVDRWTTTFPDPTGRLNFVFLAEGYDSSVGDRQAWRESTLSFARAIYRTQPYRDMVDRVNVFRVNTVSSGSGVSIVVRSVSGWEEKKTVATPFDICRVTTRKRTAHMNRPSLAENDPSLQRFVFEFKDSQGRDVYDLALRRVPGLTPLHRTCPILVVHDRDPVKATDVTSNVKRVGYWRAPCTVTHGHDRTLLHETAHQLELTEEYRTNSVMSQYDPLRLGLQGPGIDCPAENASYFRELNLPGHKWNGYHRVWWIEPDWVYIPSKLEWPFLYRPSNNCIMQGYSEGLRREFCPLCLRGIRREIDRVTGRSNVAPELLEASLVPYLGDQPQTAIPVPAGDPGASVTLKKMQPFRFTLRASDQDPGRTSQPHSIRFYFVLSLEKSGPYDPSDTQGIAGIAADWMTRPDGGEFLYPHADWGGSLTYIATGTYRLRVWVVDSGGLLSEPRTVAVTVVP